MIRWAVIVLGGFVVAGTDGLSPEPGKIDWVGGTRDFLEKASPKGRLGVRVGMLIVMTAPLWMWGRLRTAASLDATERAELLSQLLCHRIYIVRELTVLLKLVACMSLLRPASVRAQTAYDRPAPTGFFLPVVREVA